MNSDPNSTEPSELESVDNDIDVIAREALEEARRIEEARRVEEAERYRNNPGPIAPPARPVTAP